MAEQQTDHLGRELGTGTSARTVTEFAVEQGTLDGSDQGIQDALEDEKRRAETGTRRAERVSAQMAPDSPGAREDDGDQ